MGVSEKCQSLEITSYHIKLFRMVKGGDGKVENYAITTNQQWLLEKQDLFNGDTNSELNGKKNQAVKILDIVIIH